MGLWERCQVRSKTGALWEREAAPASQLWNVKRNAVDHRSIERWSGSWTEEVQDGYVDSTVARRKIGQGEVFIAELEGEAVGYARIEYLWSIRPYLALIHVLEPDLRQRHEGGD